MLLLHAHERGWRCHPCLKRSDCYLGFAAKVVASNAAAPLTGEIQRDRAQGRSKVLLARVGSGSQECAGDAPHVLMSLGRSPLTATAWRGL